MAAGTVTLTPPVGLFEDVVDDDPESPSDEEPVEDAGAEESSSSE